MQIDTASYAGKTSRMWTFLGLLVFFAPYAFFSTQSSIKPVTTLHKPYFGAPVWYHLATFGIKPLQRYQFFNGASVKPKVIRKNDRCNNGLLFVEPLGQQPGQPLMIFDNDGNLVWMPAPAEFYYAREFKVQQLGGKSYITFLNGTEVDGESYVMVRVSFSS